MQGKIKRRPGRLQYFRPVDSIAGAMSSPELLGSMFSGGSDLKKNSGKKRRTITAHLRPQPEP
jgi:hypothetical protein